MNWTLITPTGDRPEAFALCEKYMARQVAPFKQWLVSAATIALTIDALEDKIDETSAEFEELSDEDRDAYNDAVNWREGLSREVPSKSFKGLVE